MQLSAPRIDLTGGSAADFLPALAILRSGQQHDLSGAIHVAYTDHDIHCARDQMTFRAWTLLPTLTNYRLGGSRYRQWKLYSKRQLDR
jgi:hypothetical protein